jgi:hypothetical protein
MKFPDSSFALTRKHIHLIHQSDEIIGGVARGEDAALLSPN